MSVLVLNKNVRKVGVSVFVNKRQKLDVKLWLPHVVIIKVMVKVIVEAVSTGDCHRSDLSAGTGKNRVTACTDSVEMNSVETCKIRVRNRP